MRLESHEDPQEFYHAVSEMLLRNEAANNIMLGSVPQLKIGEGHKLWSFRDNSDAVLGAAMMMSKRPLDITEAPDEAIELLADHLIETQVMVPSVVAPDRQADLFSQIFCSRTGARISKVTGLGVHQLIRVTWPRRAPGAFRLARADEQPLVARWIDAFASEIGEPVSDAADRAARVLQQQRLFLWETDGVVVSMAAWTRPMPSGTAIGFVYTPPEHRGRGYASNCVATLSQRLLDGGKKFCALYTDLANPTSNKIYRDMGYRHIGDSKHVFFDAQGRGG
jgi:predicted GNAT family acetyltransferase